MENDSREFSDLTLSRAECPKCGAVWMNGQHTWATGAKGSEEDLAGLVCNNLGNHQCINPKKGVESGDTWEKRLEVSKKFADEHEGDWWNK